MKIRGFTLIELLVVIAVLGVLAGGVLVAINPLKRINQANDAKIKSDIGQIANAMQAYYVTHQYYPATLQELKDSGDLKTIPTKPDGGSYDNPSSYICTSDENGHCTEVSIAVPLDAPQTEGGKYTWNSTTGQAGEIVPPTPTATAAPTATSTPVPTATVTPTPTPLVRNGSFASDLSNWSCSPNNSPCSADTTTFKTSPKSGKVLYNTSGIVGDWGGAALVQAGITYAINEQFCLSGFIKKQNAGTSASFHIQKAGTGIASTVDISAATTAWQSQPFRGTVRTDANWSPITSLMVVVVSKSRNEAVWADDVVLTRGACQ